MKINLIYSILGVIFNTIFPIIIFPYVTRVLGVDSIGKYNYYNSFITYLALISSFGIAVFGVKEIGKKKDNISERNQVLRDLISLNVLICLVCYIILFLLICFTSYLEDIIIILTFSIILFTNAIGAEWFFVGIEKQKYLVIRNVFFKSVSLLLVFLFVKTSDDLFNYVIITTFSLSGVSFFNFYSIRKFLTPFRINWKNVKCYFFSLFFIFLIEIEIRYLALGDVVLLGNLADNYAVGIYSLALKVYILMSSLLKITAITLLPRATYYLEKQRKEKFIIFVQNTINLIFLIGLPISLILYIWSDSIVFLLGGEPFLPAAKVIKCLSFTILLNVLINTFVFQILYPYGETKNVVFIFAIGILINIILNYLLVPKLNYIGTFISMIITLFVVFVFLAQRIRHKINLGLLFSKNLFKYMVAGGVFLIVSVIIKSIFPNLFFGFQVVISCGVYGIILLLLKEPLTISLFNVIKK